MTLITIYALYFDDLRLLFFDKSQDDVFYGITLVGIICFTCEILLASYAKKDYWNSFFFWLDIVSTLSMIPDCGWIWDFLIGGEGGGDSNAYDLAKTSRAGRVTRVIRVIRLIRLIRIVKLYKQTQIAQKKAVQYRKEQENKRTLQKKASVVGSSRSQHPPPISEEDEFFEDDEESSQESVEAAEEINIPEESKISKTLSDKTIKTVVILVLVMLFSTQVMQPETYEETISIHEQSLNQLVSVYDEFGSDDEAFHLTIEHMVNRTRSGTAVRYPLIFLEAIPTA
mmetsp:Transcript_28745/g.43412  ORF Transcript_28745/g.43412 Transcript_28745/m.43412 type:complete len:284 (+) Transcript_28745:698-1549(+)|eukprot:CAMPEP_0170499848 /NCGR_PEP_ID=MMETSP0208-20121228/32852_1 /TAXON_ID=197538 /ORGANISM="Strombidium inclinatum, Strain S3" /LENGTH=283 /DNA_ID=CAMNT_0010777589 /DNA_START=618 /DNA_END=1469 /DNA_ORIENTATION=-